MPEGRRRVYFATDLDGSAVKTCFRKLLERYDEAASDEEAEFIVFDLYHLPEEYERCLPEERKHHIEVDLNHHLLPCFLVQLPPSARPKNDYNSGHKGCTVEASVAGQGSAGASAKGDGGVKRGKGTGRRAGIRNDVKKLKRKYKRVFEVEKICRSCEELLTEMVWFENMMPFRRKRKDRHEEQTVKFVLSVLKQNDARGGQLNDR